MLAIFGNLDFLEIVLILIVSVVVFGDRLPEVAMKAAAHLVKLRRTVMKMWREAGLEEELRRVQREIDLDVKKIPNPRQYVQQKVDSLVRDDDIDETDESVDPDAHRAEDEDSHAAHEGPDREGPDREPHLVVDAPDAPDDTADRREPIADARAGTEAPSSIERLGEFGQGVPGPSSEADGPEGAADDPGRETA